MPVNVLVFAAGVGDRSLGWKKGVFCAMCVLYLGVYLHYFFNEKKQRPEGAAVWSVAQELQNREVSSPEEPKVLIPGHP